MAHRPISQICIQNIIALGLAYAKSRNPEYKLTSVSTLAHGDPQFLPRLVSGKGSLTVRKYDTVMAFFDKKWPSNVPRPKIKDLVAKPR